ncbi:hypothetical protein Hanom_Chr00s000006g01613521 [Helianthus anomalus]
MFMQTINDVLFGIISYGLSKYLDNRSSKRLQMTGVAMVNLRPQRGYQVNYDFLHSLPLVYMNMSNKRN